MANRQTKRFSVKERIRSFSYAFNGLKILFREEHNARIHAVVAIIVVIAGLFFKLSAMEWLVVLLLIGFVFVAETVNSAIEDLCDHVCREQNEKIKKVKDLAAASVFIAAMISIIAGIVLFMPKFVQMLK